ncbi:MAG: hypothetical protein KAR17_08190, partial [Cyclobacteriaceae bacterium]|nr:hypothetical protein [Cyclobacteriaceae bacterium]
IKHPASPAGGHEFYFPRTPVKIIKKNMRIFPLEGVVCLYMSVYQPHTIFKLLTPLKISPKIIFQHST